MRGVKEIRRIRVYDNYRIVVGIPEGQTFRILTYAYWNRRSGCGYHVSTLWECPEPDPKIFRQFLEANGYKTKMIEIPDRPWVADRIIASPVKADI